MPLNKLTTNLTEPTEPVVLLDDFHGVNVAEPRPAVRDGWWTVHGPTADTTDDHPDDTDTP